LQPQWRIAMRDAGFSLVEVLVATVLLALSLTALAELFAILREE
jgi:prepilin-type N-terminal cleavage/methylation domain-containing protein